MCSTADHRRVNASRKESAYRYLIRMIGELESQGVGDLALLGFSMGGHWAYWLSRRPELPISKTVTFYAARDGDYSTKLGLSRSLRPD